MIPDGFLQGADGQLPFVGDIDFRELGVKPALTIPGFGVISPYVSRECDSDFRKALKKGGLVVVQGPVRSGRTRTAFEGIRAVFSQRSILAPQTRRALEGLSQIGMLADSVVWLDDVERFDDPDFTLISGLCSPDRSDIVVVATIEDRASCSSVLSRRASNIFSITRELSKIERGSAERLQSDPRISAALSLGNVRLAEDLAAGPLLRDRWRGDSVDLLSATGTAIVSAAIDVYLAGYSGGVSDIVLEQLHRLFLPEGLRYNPGLPPFLEALAWACVPVYGFSSLLVGQPEDRYRASYQLAYWLSHQIDRPVVRDETWESVLKFADSRSCRVVGTHAFMAKRHDLAERALLRAIGESDPDDKWVAEVNNDLGVVLVDQGRRDEAEQIFLKSALAGVTTGMANFARILAERGDTMGAEKWNRRAAGMGDTQAIDQLVEQLGARGDYAEAAYWCRIALRVGDGAPSCRLASHIKAADLQSAECLLREAVDHEDPLAMVNLGRILEERQEFEEAKTLYQKASEIGFGAGCTALGMLEERNGDLDEARRHYRRGAAAGDVPAIRQLGILYLNLSEGDDEEDGGRLAEGYKLLEQAAERDDDQAALYLAVVLYRLGRPHRAREWLRNAADRGYAPAMVLLAEHYKRQGDLERAGQRMAEVSTLVDAEEIAKIRSMFSEWISKWIYVAVSEGEQLPTHNADSWLKLAGSLIDHRGEVARSEQECRNAVDAGDDTALMDLAILLILRQDLEEAWLLILCASDRGDSDGLAAHSFLLMVGGDYLTAEILINRVSDIDHPMVAVLKLAMSARSDDNTGVTRWLSKVSIPLVTRIRSDWHGEALFSSMGIRLEPGLTLSKIGIDSPRDGLVPANVGSRTVADRQNQRRDPMARRNACRQALLLWLYAGESGSDRSLGLASIHETPLGYHYGERFTMEELRDAVAYLRQRSLVTTSGESSTLTIPADGLDCVERYHASIGKFLESGNVNGQSINFSGHNYGNVAAVGTGDAVQNQNHTEGVDTEELLKALHGIRAVIPHLDLEQPHTTDLEKAIDQVEQEADTLTPSRARTMLERIRAILVSSTSVLAFGVLSAVERLIAGLSG